MPSRRAILRSVATVGGLAAVYSGPAAAEFDEQPDHVTIYGLDEARSDIETYQPLLDLSALEIRPSNNYAWKITSDEYDYDWYCYWTFYQAQSGTTAEDSHLPDREPVYVAVDTGEVDHIVISDWHYSAQVVDDPSLYESTHPKLEVIRPWHGTRTTTSEGEFVSLADMKDEYPSWLVNGWNVHRRSVVDPPTAERRGNWWREDDQTNHRLAVLWHELSIPGNPFRLDDWNR